MVRQLKRTVYKPSYTLVGHRNEFCVNSAVVHEPSCDAACQLAVAVNQAVQESYLNSVVDRLPNVATATSTQANHGQ